MEKKIKSFGEYIRQEHLHEAEEAVSTEIDEGWKEVLIAGALALSMGRGYSQGPNSTRDVPKTNTEQTQKAVDKQKVTVDFGSDFLSGRYKISEEKSAETEAKLKQLADFIKLHQNTDVIITVIAGESQVPNRDFEAGKQADGEYKKLPVGALAKNRAEVMKSVVGTFMQALDKQGIVKGNYRIVTANPVIGTTVYKPGEDAHQEKFTREQFVRVTIEAEGQGKTATVAPRSFAAWAKEGQMIYIPAGAVSNRAIGEIRYTSRDARDITANGMKDTGYEDLLLQEIDKMGKLTGKSFLIPWKWWNSTVGQHTRLTTDQWDYIQQHFAVK